MNFFEDDDSSRTASTPTGSPSSRRRVKRGKKGHLRIQRLIVILIALFLVVFLLALWVKDCRQSEKVNSYRTYLAQVTAVLSETQAVGKDLAAVIGNPTQYSRKQLTAKLGTLITKHKEIAQRVSLFHPPGHIAAQHAVLAQGLQVRSEGLQLLRDAIVGAMNGTADVTAGKLAAIGAYFTGPDAYYTDQFYTQVQQAMRDDGVSGVEVPTATYFLTTGMFDKSKMTTMLQSITQSASLAGIHGVALVGVSVAGQTLATGSNTEIMAAADMAFVVTVQNSGNVTESAVPVKLTLKPPGAQAQTLSQTIGSIAASKTATVQFTGFDISSDMLGRVCTLTAEAGPVAREAVINNNKKTFKIILTLSS